MNNIDQKSNKVKMAKRKSDDTLAAVTPAKSKKIQGIPAVTPAKSNAVQGILKGRNSLPGSPNRSVHFRPPSELQMVLQGIHTGKTDQSEVTGLLNHLESLRGQTLVLWLKELQANISLLDLQMEQFVSELLKISWADQEIEVIDAFKSFLMNLVSAHAIYTKHVVRSLVSKFRPIIDNDPLSFKNNKPDEFNKKEQQTFANTHSVIKGLLEVSPVGVKDELIRQTDQLFPYIKSTAHKTACYVSNIIYLRSYLLSGKKEILQILMERLVKLDAHVPRDEIEANLADNEYEYDGDPFLTDNQAMSLDLFMSFLFKLLHEETHITDCDEPVYDPAKSSDLFKDMIQIYKTHVLSTFQISHAQFLYFYLSGLNPKLGMRFFETNWRIFTNPNSASLDRQTAISYIASFVSRAQFVNISMAKVCLEKLVSWIHGYIRNSNVSTALDFMYTDLKCHGPFYAACQAAFYIFAFRHQEFVEDPNMLKFTQSLSFNSIVTSHLNPLRVCLPAVVRNFSSIARNYQLAYCQTVIERNNRLNLPVVGSLSSSSDLGKPLLLDCFFPFDPYLLPQSKPWIEEMYRAYQSQEDSHSDSEEEDDDKDEEEDDLDETGKRERKNSTGSMNSLNSSRSHRSRSDSMSLPDFLCENSPGFKKVM